MGIRITVFDGIVREQAKHYSADDREEIAREISTEGAVSSAVLTGSYKSSFDVERDGDRVSSVNNDDAAGYITFGTSDTPPHPAHVDAARRRGRYTGDNR